MTVAELIMRLSAHNPSLEVLITDSWAGSLYSGAFSVRSPHIDDNVLLIDVGGYQLEEER